MSPSSTVYVAFGYDLGGEDTGEWRLEGIDRWDTFDDLELPWCPPNVAHARLDEVMEIELLRGRSDHYVLPLKVVTYQHPDFSQFALVSSESLITYYHGSPARVLDPYTMKHETRIERWELELREALDLLGLKPTQKHGQWLLMSYWS